MAAHIRQLAVYAQIMASDASRPAENLHLYRTTEHTRDTALQSIPNESRLTADAMTQVNAIARQNQAHDFTVHQPPHPSVSQDSSLLTLCRRNGGNVKLAQRKVQGNNQTWTITVEPDGNGAVSITLPETTNCNAEGGICTSHGRKLSNSTSASIAGPQ